jgi:excisionase family DNA binding protein
MNSNTSASVPILQTVEEAAADLNVGRSTIYELIRSGHIEIVKIGRCTRIPREAVLRYVDQLRNQSRVGA